MFVMVAGLFLINIVHSNLTCNITVAYHGTLFLIYGIRFSRILKSEQII